MKVEPYKDRVFKQIRQPISGYPMGYKLIDVWRFKVTFGAHSLVSSKTYKDRTNAIAAGKRFMNKLNERDS